jgi:hypothetical protein
MSVVHQIADVVVAGLIAGLATFMVGAVIPPSRALTIGVLFAAMYYFSRNPWGSPDGDRYNDAIDDLYDRYLP